MRSAALFFLLAQLAHSFVIPVKLAAVVNQTEQAEVLTERDLWTWTTTVIIGTPGTAFTVAIDTTGSFLFVPDVSSGKNNSFDASKSSTFIHTPYSFSSDIEGQCEYGDIYGTIGRDTVILGESFSSNPTRTSITVPNATFGLSKNSYYCLENGVVDGILGLAFPGLAPRGSTPVFQTAINQKNVAIGTYVIWLEDQWESNDNGTQGVIYYGNVDNLHCKADQRQMYPLSSGLYFQFTVPSVTISGAVNSTWNKNTQATIASRSSYIVLPNQLMQAVIKQLNAKTLPPIVPCNTKIDLAFNMPYGTVHVTELNLLEKESDGTCRLLLIDGGNGASSDFTLGIPFLRGRCTFFDVSNQQIGFSEPLTHGGHNSL